jgi:hypothetical protein
MISSFGIRTDFPKGDLNENEKESAKKYFAPKLLMINLPVNIITSIEINEAIAQFMNSDLRDPNNTIANPNKPKIALMAYIPRPTSVNNQVYSAGLKMTG